MDLVARQPAFKVVANDKDITAALTDRLVSLTLTDNAKTDEADTLALEIAYDGLDLILPPRGAVLQVWLGYTHTSLVNMGKFVVDKRPVNPYSITFNAQATPVNNNAKFGRLDTQRTRTFPANVTLSTLATLVASSNNLTTVIRPPLSNLTLGKVYQRHESDLHLLTRLSKDFDFRFKIANGALIVYLAGDASNGGTVPLPTTTVNKADCLDWHWDDDGKNEGGSVVTRYRDGNKAVQLVTAGSGQPIRQLKRVYPTIAQATAAANSHLTKKKKDQTLVMVEIEGDTSLIAEGKMALAGFFAEMNRTYTILKAVHQLDGSGYRTRLEGY